MLPYPSLGTKTDGNPLSVRKLAGRYFIIYYCKGDSFVYSFERFRSYTSRNIIWVKKVIRVVINIIEPVYYHLLLTVKIYIFSDTHRENLLKNYSFLKVCALPGPTEM